MTRPPGSRPSAVPRAWVRPIEVVFVFGRLVRDRAASVSLRHLDVATSGERLFRAGVGVARGGADGGPPDGPSPQQRSDAATTRRETTRAGGRPSGAVCGPTHQSVPIAGLFAGGCLPSSAPAFRGGGVRRLAGGLRPRPPSRQSAVGYRLRDGAASSPSLIYRGHSLPRLPFLAEAALGARRSLRTPLPRPLEHAPVRVRSPYSPASVRG